MLFTNQLTIDTPKYALSERTQTFLEFINMLYFQVDFKSTTPLVTSLFPLTEHELDLKHRSDISKYQKKRLTPEEITEYRDLVNYYEVDLWVNRIVQMFSPKQSTSHLGQLNKQLVQHIVNFFDVLHDMPKELKALLLTNQNALNSILLTLLLCKCKDKWNATVELIKAESIDIPHLTHLLEWGYSSFIEIDKERSSAITKELLSKDMTQVLTPFHTVFHFAMEAQKVIASNTDVSNQQDLKNDCILLLDLQNLAELSYMGFCACSYTLYGQPLIKDLYYQIIDIFLVSYIKLPHQSLPTDNERLEFMLNLAFRLLVGRIGCEAQDYSKIDILISLLERKSELIGGCGDASVPKVIISVASTCFDESQYKRATTLYKYVKSFDTNVEGPHRSALYEFFYRMELWLTTENGVINEDLMALLVKNIFKNDQNIKTRVYLVGAVHEKLVDFGNRILKRYEKNQDKKYARTMEAQFEHIMTLLGAGRARELQKIFQTLKDATVKVKPAKKIDLSWLDEKKTRKQSVSNNHHKSNRNYTLPEEDVSPVFIKQDPVVEVLVPKPKHEPMVQKQRFFSEKSSPDLQEKWSIERSRIPDALVNLVQTIESNFKEFKVFLTGGAVQALVSRKEPNDYDLVVVLPSQAKETLYELQKLLLNSLSLCEVRGSTHQILHCVLKELLKVDITLINRKPKQGVESCLRADALTRDFNISAMYLPLGGQEKHIKVISYSEILNHDTPNLIRIVHRTPDAMFYDDPLRALRLAHLLINYPEYALDDGLQKQLVDMKNKWSSVFKKYVDYIPNKSRMSHAMRKLFSRYTIEQLNSVFDTIDLMPVFLSRSKKDISQASLLIPKNIENQHRLIAWLVAVSLFPQKKYTRLQPQPICSFIVWNQLEQLWVNYLFHKGKKPDEPTALLSIVDQLQQDATPLVTQKIN